MIDTKQYGETTDETSLATQKIMRSLAHRDYDDVLNHFRILKRKGLSDQDFFEVLDEVVGSRNLRWRNLRPSFDGLKEAQEPVRRTLWSIIRGGFKKADSPLDQRLVDANKSVVGILSTIHLLGNLYYLFCDRPLLRRRIPHLGFDAHADLEEFARACSDSGIRFPELRVYGKDDSLRAFKALVPVASSVQSLHISVREDQLSEVDEHLSEFKNLIDLRIYLSSETSGGVQKGVDFLRHFPQLRSLSIAGFDCSDEELADRLRPLRFLQELDVSRMENLTGDFLDALEVLPKLKILTLHNLPKLRRLVEKHAGIESLSLDGDSQLVSEDLQALRSWGSLQRMDFSGLPGEDDERLLEEVMGLQDIKRVDIEGTFLEESVLEALEANFPQYDIQHHQDLGVGDFYEIVRRRSEEV